MAVSVSAPPPPALVLSFPAPAQPSPREDRELREHYVLGRLAHPWNLPGWLVARSLVITTFFCHSALSLRSTLLGMAGFGEGWHGMGNGGNTQASLIPTLLEMRRCVTPNHTLPLTPPPFLLPSSPDVVPQEEQLPSCRRDGKCPLRDVCVDGHVDDVSPAHTHIHTSKRESAFFASTAGWVVAWWWSSSGPASRKGSPGFASD